MKPHRQRLERCINALDRRAENQSTQSMTASLFDAAVRTNIIDRYHRSAASVEKLLPVADNFPAGFLARHVRGMRTLLAEHAALLPSRMKT